ncbi:ZYRO0A10450p [Zygosaccharomyces rouxii]|uniref:ZYRO0A10450p n=1 Tax=Zygosaccharomyces rouxii (strain ATCC 2623 / CBS 732 / NBRC 1130 / NCYC 568 / NRRL Y-229) TaxID=559307 RepID=C5DQC8_ZYGRC|nr:uncharacterized protein ZYRO0A10450g [Zygosaccharomyces rouxii]KAH9198592.1 Rpp20 subunit of nuclear RNase MRP and P-domain-containing protein [Zygosaccharomyces rouxii]CAR25889.1 ZYRO0A10450p [Zygosaccharomyces rouxii]
MAKLIKKHPTVKSISHKQVHSTLYLKSKTPYVSALKRINKFLANVNRTGSTYVIVLGMGKAVEKALSLACHFQDQLQKRVEILTKSVDVMDELSNDDDDDPPDVDTELRKRTISGVEIRIYP